MRNIICRIMKVLIISLLIISQLAGCAPLGRKFTLDEAKSRLNDRFGKESYTIKNAPDNEDGWIVILKDYPNISFSCGSYKYSNYMISPIENWAFGTSFESVFSQTIIDEYQWDDNMNCSFGVGTTGKSDTFYINVEMIAPDDIKSVYDFISNFKAFVVAEYPIMIEQSRFNIAVNLRGDFLENNYRFSELVWVDENGMAVMLTYSEFYEKIMMKEIHQNGK